MRKLLLAAMVASLGLARAADPSATPQAGAEPHAEKANKVPRKGAAKPKAKGVPPAEKPSAKPCEPVKPCPIDG